MKRARTIATGFRLDKYTREARLKPSLVVVLPVFVTVAVWLPKVWTILGGLVAIISACGLTLLLAEVARFQGRKVEHTMITANDGKFTTILLRHRDPTISTATKKTYHAFLKKASKRILPTVHQEQTDPLEADDCYRGAVDWLLEATRSEKHFPLVRAENISYGFRRNLLGLKPPAVLLIALCMAANIWFCIRNFHVDSTRVWAGFIVSIALVAVGLVWSLVVNLTFVEDAGRAYALRLLAQCDVLQRKTRSGTEK